ncbi:hypothetical protein, partial [Klebsiella pneumoniae]|uniref:hypothetical protein n=1 Tax=Klebsiella pneumoniae TaxID=573 RepID=UPI00406AB5D5
LKMPAFEWVHVQLHQQKGMISLSPPTICNSATVGGLMAVTAVLPTNTGRPAFDALVVFSTWYPIGVMLLVFASRPLGRLIRQRAQERRK